MEDGTPISITTTATGLLKELARRGIDDSDTLTVTIEVGPELFPGRRASRLNVVAAGLSDDEIDRMVKQAQAEGEPRP